jgi:hypothetical protein
MSTSATIKFGGPMIISNGQSKKKLSNMNVSVAKTPKKTNKLKSIKK